VTARAHLCGPARYEVRIARERRIVCQMSRPAENALTHKLISDVVAREALVERPAVPTLDRSFLFLVLKKRQAVR
jgi:hypothetical protein